MVPPSPTETEMRMHSQPHLHRQCSDCYYRTNHGCKFLDGTEQRFAHDSTENCEFFIRASLRFAFFQKI